MLTDNAQEKETPKKKKIKQGSAQDKITKERKKKKQEV